MPSFPPPRTNRSAAKVAAVEVPTTRALTSIITTVVIVCALYFGRSVLIPIILAILLSFLVSPFVAVLRRWKLGYFPSVMIAIMTTLGVLAAIGVLIAVQIVQLSSDLPHYQREFERKVRNLEHQTMGKANAFLNRASIDLSRIAPAPPHATSFSNTTNVGAIPVEVHAPPATPMALARQFASVVIGPLQKTAIVFVVAIFILLQREDLRDRLIRLLGSRDLHRTTTAMDEAARRLSRYFLAQLGVNVGVGVLIGSGLMVIGLPGALLFGVVAALLRFVPYVGTWIAALTAVFFAGVIGPNWSMLIWTIVLFSVVDIVSSQIVEPLVYGRSTGLSPFAVIVAAIFWSWIWGPVGLVLSTPLTLCLVILGRHVERLAFLEVLFGDRPALTPAENFYQRLLANDPDELLVQAETLLKVRPLSTYYDEVALVGLRLAHNDLLRGVVTPEQVKRITESAQDIVEGLEETADLMKSADGETPAIDSPAEGDDLDGPWSPPPMSYDAEKSGRHVRVVCIAGRGELDNLAGLIVVQLLNKHGLDAELQPYTQFTRTQFNDADIARVPIVCIVSFDTMEETSYLRNLQRRLKAGAPDATLVVGVGDPDSTLLGLFEPLSSMSIPSALDGIAAAAPSVVPRESVPDVVMATTFKQVVNRCVIAARSYALTAPPDAPISVHEEWRDAGVGMSARAFGR